MGFTFGEYFLDVDRRELRRHGAVVPLAPQVFDLLLYLLRNRDRVVTKDDLLEAVWGGRIVSESALTTRISAARMAIGDSGGAQQLIRTLPRKGFRFIGLVQEAGILQMSIDAQTLSIAELSDRPSVAVLPFENMSGDPEEEYFTEGLVEKIITALGRIKRLFVIACDSRGVPKGHTVDAKQIGREMGVRYLLDGSARKVDGRVRITAQLIDAASGAHPWADWFDGSLDAVFKLQNQVAIGVAGGTERALQSAQIHASADFPEQAKAHDARPPDPIAAERRQLTVISCNLVEWTALAPRLDPEDLRDLIADYRRATAELVTRFEGSFAERLDDVQLIYFGYPFAREDDGERAIRCALNIADTVSRLKFDEKLRTRVGVATSIVVVGDAIDSGGPLKRSVIGEAPNLAARLRQLAEPNSVVVAESTRRLVGDLFEYRYLVAVDVEGAARPVPAWQVLGPSGVASRFEALRGAVLSPLVGRDEEMDLLSRRWARTKAGDGQIALISGEPGIGKSRIIAALEERLDTEPHLRLRYFCSPYHQDSALYPFIDQLGRASGFAPDDPPECRLEKLEGLLARVALPEEDVRFLAELLSLPPSEHHALRNLSTQRKKERTLEALIRQLEGLARRQPVVMVFEDAHWIDPTSRELLDLAVERARNLPVLLIVTFRPEFRPPWIGEPRVTMLALNRLDRRDRVSLVTQIARKALPDEVIAQIIDRADGVPLFVEELTKSVLESGLLHEQADRYVLDGALPSFAIPTGLHALLMARLDRLGSVRWVAQTGAAIGREFSYPMLHAVSGLPEDELQAALSRLVASELVFQRGVPPGAVYAFKHVLVQDAAHNALLRNARQKLHKQIAEALEAHSPELMDAQPELFAQHYAEAGLVEKSVAYWAKAGRRSAGRSAMVEAAAQLHKGLDQLALLEDKPERQRQELEFWSALGAVLRAVKGTAAPETGNAYARARELWKQLGSPSKFLQVPFGHSRYHMFRGEFDLAHRLDAELLRLSRQRNDSAGLVLGHLSSGRTQLFVGRFARSRSHLEGALGLYDPSFHRALVHQAGVDPRAASQAFLGVVLFCLGFPDRALVQSNAAIAEARRLAHPPSLAGSLAIGARLLSLGGDDTALDEWVGQLIAMTTEQGFPHWGAEGTICLGWLKVKNGDLADGLSLLRSGLRSWRATGAKTWMPHHIALLARAYEIAGRIEEGLALLDEALQIAEKTGERWLTAELNRHQGQLLLREGHSEAAEKLFRIALSIAEDQGAKLWELRAAMSLARLRRDQGRHAEACNLLAPVYGWFTEGFDTPDLKEAKDLLDTLDRP